MLNQKSLQGFQDLALDYLTNFCFCQSPLSTILTLLHQTSFCLRPFAPTLSLDHSSSNIHLACSITSFRFNVTSLTILHKTVHFLFLYFYRIHQHPTQFIYCLSHTTRKQALWKQGHFLLLFTTVPPVPNTVLGTFYKYLWKEWINFLNCYRSFYFFNDSFVFLGNCHFLFSDLLS